MKIEFVVILQKLVNERGRETLLNVDKCKEFLSEYTNDEFKNESLLLLQALNIGVHKVIDTAVNISICKKQQIKLLHENYGMDKMKAKDVVDTLTLVLRKDVIKSYAKALIKKGNEYSYNNVNKQ